MARLSPISSIAFNVMISKINNQHGKTWLYYQISMFVRVKFSYSFRKRALKSKTRFSSQNYVSIGVEMQVMKITSQFFRFISIFSHCWLSLDFISALCLQINPSGSNSVAVRYRRPCYKALLPSQPQMGSANAIIVMSSGRPTLLLQNTLYIANVIM